LRLALSLLNPPPFFNMPTQTLRLAALLAVLLAVALAAAASVTVHGDRELVGDVTVVEFDEGKKPVYFILWWPPDDAKYVNLTAYLPYRAEYRGWDVSVALFSDGLDVRLVGMADTNGVAKPMVKPGARCAYAADPTFVVRAEGVSGGAGWLGYLAWCLAGNVTLRAHGVNLTLPLWAFMGGYSKVYGIGVDRRFGDGDDVRVSAISVYFPEEGYAVWWPAVLPMVADPALRAWAIRAGEDPRRYEDVWKWRVSSGPSLGLWPGSYLVVGVWPNGTVRQWRFVARPIFMVERTVRPSNLTGVLAELCRYGIELGCDGDGYPEIPALWADEPLSNYNHLLGDRGNGTVVAWFHVPYTRTLKIFLYPNGTAAYVVTREVANYTSARTYLILALWRYLENTYQRIFDFLAYTFYRYGYLPEGDYDEFDLMSRAVAVRNGTPLTVVDIYAPRIFPNGTLVVKHYVITNDTGCVGFYIVERNGTRWFRYTHKVAGCRLDQFLVEVIKLDVTPLGIPYLCSKCGSHAGFKPHDVRIPNSMFEWIFVAPAPTVITPLLSYRGDEVASVKYCKYKDGELVEVGLFGGLVQYAVITFTKASKEYYDLRIASQIVRLLIP